MTRDRENLYYTPPSDELFEEMKALATVIWNSYDDTHRYASDKISRIKDISNIQDNFMYILAMFDTNNQNLLLAQSSPGLHAAVRERLEAGGMPDEDIITYYPTLIV